MNELTRWFALIAFSLFIGGMSLLMWKLPIQILAPSFYEQYFVPANGHIASYLLLAWFLIGGYKTTLLMAWDKRESYFKSIRYQLKALALVPFAPILKFKTSWFRLPSVDYMRNK